MLNVHDHPQLRPGARTGVWCATKLATDAGGWRQINRGGHPMMWPISWPGDTGFTDPANTRHPSGDLAAADQVAAVVAATGACADPERQDRSPAAVPGCAALRRRNPCRYGFNGRTLADNASEAMLSLVTNTAVPSGLKPSVAQHLRTDHFPYIVPA
ncbi:hypothetical protein [Streptomyces sp. NPDC059224]|uniref:hypothetical protein n=1 Tax=Streptomyces sp. NPDC059224 TaxID=3346775 RepID=UPI0036AEBA10